MIKQDRILGKYLEYRICLGDNPQDVATKARLLAEFISSQERLNITSCRNFVRVHNGENSFRRMEPVFKDFMNFTFGNGRKTGTVKTVKALEKLSAITERNIEIAGRFVAWLNEQRDYSPNTIASYRHTIVDFHEYANEISNETVRGYLQALKESDKSPKTINIRLNALKKYAEFLEIPLSVKRQKVVRTLNTENVPTEKEYTALMEYIAAHSESFYLVMYTLSHTGARVSELLQFKIDDILNGDVVLCGKGGKYRRFFFTKENIRLAKEFRERNSRVVMLCNNKYGETLSSRGLSLKIKYYGEKAGVRKEICHPHAFRHYFAKSYLKRSKDVVQLAEILGHSSVDTTRIYLQKSLAEQRKDFNKHVDW